MIEIITGNVKMPPLLERRYQLASISWTKWVVIDAENKRIRYKGSFEMCALARHNLNKKYYMEINNDLTIGKPVIKYEP